MSLRCTIGRHDRSAGLARIVDDQVVSACKRCGAPLVRTGPRQWIVADVRRLGQAGA